MAFDPNSVSPSKKFVDYYIASDTRHNEVQSATFWAQWGAAQAVEALKLQMPTDGIRDRLPTAEDANEGGYVQVLFNHLREDGTTRCWWYLQGWELVAKRGGTWLHTPDWVPNPSLALKREGAALLNLILPTVLDDGDSSISPEQVALLRRIVALIPEESASAHDKTTPETPLTIGLHVVKPGDRLVLRNKEVITVYRLNWGDDLWLVSYKGTYGVKDISVYANGTNPFRDEQSILSVIP